MSRILFEKTSNAIWISHLDLMRVFQRAFRRAELPLTHSQGFNPRPSVSIALPLSVGIESQCELLDFTLDGEAVPCDEIKHRLNKKLTDGIVVREVYDDGRKLRELVFLHSTVTLEYDGGVPQNATTIIRDLFTGDSLIVPKKTKNGIQDQDLIPMIDSIEVRQAGEKEIVLDVVGYCQNPTLNPMQLAVAVNLHLPHLAPDFAKCRRIEVLDGEKNVFR